MGPSLDDVIYNLPSSCSSYSGFASLSRTASASLLSWHLLPQSLTPRVHSNCNLLPLLISALSASVMMSEGNFPLLPQQHKFKEGRRLTATGLRSLRWKLISREASVCSANDYLHTIYSPTMTICLFPQTPHAVSRWSLAHPPSAASLCNRTGLRSRFHRWLQILERYAECKADSHLALPEE